jgi:hypothetical protein
VLLDWDADECNDLTVERVGGAPSTPARTLDEQAELTAAYMRRYADYTHQWTSRSLQEPANSFGLAHVSDQGGALRNQVYIGGHFALADDEAFVITVNDGGAAYFTVPISNQWGTTLDLVHRTSTLNKAQAQPDPDGAYTFVISRHDPGVHNWLDPCGLSAGMLTLRMAEFPGGRPRDDLAARSEVVPVADLASRLPEGTAWVTPEQRGKQQAERAASYLRRLPEGLL